jgi:hypothetical protein
MYLQKVISGKTFKKSATLLLNYPIVTPVKKKLQKTVKKGELSSLPQLFPGSEATIMDNFRECSKTSATI